MQTAPYISTHNRIPKFLASSHFPRFLDLGLPGLPFLGRPAFPFGLSHARVWQKGQRFGSLPFCENHDSLH